MPNEEWMVLDDLLEPPVEVIDLGHAQIRVMPAALAELRDSTRFFAHHGLAEGDELPATGSKSMLEFWQYIFWLLLRNGTPGLTLEKAVREEWDITLETAGLILPKYLHGKDLQIVNIQQGVSELAVKAGLFSKEVGQGEAEGGESPTSTPTSLPPESERASGIAAEEPTGETYSPLSLVTESTLAGADGA